MGFPENVLAPNEKVLVSLRPHWRVVAAPTVIAAILVAGSAYVAWRTPDDTTGNRIQWVVVGVALLLGSWLVVVPFVERACTQYVITSHRVMVRKGVFTKNGKDIALSKVTDVSFSKTPSDRILGSGTLRVESAGDSPDETFHSIPHSDRIQQLLNHAIEADANKRAQRMAQRTDTTTDTDTDTEEDDSNRRAERMLKQPGLEPPELTQRPDSAR